MFDILCSHQGFVEVHLPSSPQSDHRALRVMWAVKGLEFWFELTESNFEYLVHLFRHSEPEEKVAKPKSSPSRRRRLKRRLSEEDQQPEQQNED